jgi:mercuric ion transport protein
MSKANNPAVACPLPRAARGLEARGLLWVGASFLLCPCHLPLTLFWAGVLLAGTTAGALLASHPVVAGVLVTALWAAGTWRGFHLLRAARRVDGRIP